MSKCQNLDVKVTALKFQSVKSLSWQVKACQIVSQSVISSQSSSNVKMSAFKCVNEKSKKKSISRVVRCQNESLV